MLAGVLTHSDLQRASGLWVVECAVVDFFSQHAAEKRWIDAASEEVTTLLPYCSEYSQAFPF